ncbi:hypothetical protein [Aeromonas veronii]|uniref:hypothetical protein n=1 Tax=Aeromonas veronii TaxID=654 RepID=UPI003D1C42D5
MSKYNFFERIVLQLPMFFLLFIFSGLYLEVYYQVTLLNDPNNLDILSGLVNLHDHNVYVGELDKISNDGISYELNNDVGIALIYYVLYIASALCNVIDIYLFSFLLNSLFLWFSFYYYNKICSKHRLPDVACLLFFLNFSFIYFSQLINKDMLTVFILIYSLYLGVRGCIIKILLIIPLAFLVRQQLALCLFVFAFLINVKKPLFWMVTSYIIGSLAAGYISAHVPIISEESMGGGLSSFLMALNSQYYIGSLFLNPVRFIQYFFSVPQSLMYTFMDVRFDFAAGLRALTLPLAILAFLFFSRSLSNIKATLNSGLKVYFLLAYSFFICWLLNPTINSRYLMLILPIMVLGYFYQSEIVKKNDK